MIEQIKYKCQEKNLYDSKNEFLETNIQCITNDYLNFHEHAVNHSDHS